VKKSPAPAAATLGLKELVAMGVGGMVGGGIFSVLGLSIGLAGHAASAAFALGGGLALITGWSYAKLGLCFHSDGGSFTYLEHAFRHPNIAGLGGWLLIAGYVGTMALYAYTFGAYGTALLGDHAHGVAAHHFLESLILVLFLGLNLYGVQAAAETEDLIVLVKVAILLVFAGLGFFLADASKLFPFFDRGGVGFLMGATLIFVAYEGFELIPNAVNETRDPARNLPRAILIAIAVTAMIYVLVAIVAVVNLKPAQIAAFKEYALAVAAQPLLGRAGFVLIGIGAVLSTASAINATMFGTARLASIMASEHALPCAFAHRNRNTSVPWISLIALTAVTLVFVNLADLGVISRFASATFLLIFAAVNLSAFRLRKRIGIGMWMPLLGGLGCLASWGVLMAYMGKHDPRSLKWLLLSYLAIAAAEFLFSERRLFLRPAKCGD